MAALAVVALPVAELAFAVVRRLRGRTVPVVRGSRAPLRSPGPAGMAPDLGEPGLHRRRRGARPGRRGRAAARRPRLRSSPSTPVAAVAPGGAGAPPPVPCPPTTEPPHEPHLPLPSRSRRRGAAHAPGRVRLQLDRPPRTGRRRVRGRVRRAGRRRPRRRPLERHGRPPPGSAHARGGARRRGPGAVLHLRGDGQRRQLPGGRARVRRLHAVDVEHRSRPGGRRARRPGPGGRLPRRPGDGRPLRPVRRLRPLLAAAARLRRPRGRGRRRGARCHLPGPRRPGPSAPPPSSPSTGTRSSPRAAAACW